MLKYRARVMTFLPVLLQSHVGPTQTRQLHKISSKNPDFEAIYHFRVDSYQTLAWSQMFFLILPFLQSSEDESRVMFTASWLSRSSLMRRKIKENLFDQGNHASAEERSIC